MRKSKLTWYHLTNKIVLFIDPPTVDTLSQRDIIEERDLSITCTATPANPSFTTFWWTNEDNSGFKQNGATLQLYNIQRNSSDTYRCTAENSYCNGKKGPDSQFTVVSVQCRSLMSNAQPCIYFCRIFFTSLKRFFLWYLYLFEFISLVCVLLWSVFNNNTGNIEVPLIHDKSYVLFSV